MSHVNLKVIASHYGLNVGADGASAQMNCDVAMIKALPDVTIINPADYNQAIQATNAIAETKGMQYLRVTREKFPVFIKPDSQFQIGNAQKLLDGSDITVITTGSMVYEALQAANDSGVSVDFLNIHTIKPLDENIIVESAKKTGKVIVVEEHNIWGGLGESVARVLAAKHPTKLEVIGVQDTFGESGSHRDLWKKYELDREYINSVIRSLIK
jgi:transketolase